MNAAQMPGMGDEITWGQVWHPNDPRMPEIDDAEGDDGTLVLPRTRRKQITRLSTGERDSRAGPCGQRP